MGEEQFTLEGQIQRLKEVAGVKTDTDLARLLGITQGGFFNAKRRNSVPHKWFVAISTKYGVNLEWLVSGTGPRDVGQPVQSGVCQQCVELQKQLTIASERLVTAGERLYEAMRENGDLKEEVGKLKEELAALKNKQSPTATEQNPMVSASGT